MDLQLKSYSDQNKQWPQKGRVILCQETPTSIVVYQSYNASIGSYAAAHNKFEGCPHFSMTRMSWIKTNFLWMMYRNGWATKKNQEVVLAIHLKKDAFKDILKQAVSSSASSYSSKEEYQKVKLASQVRLQWDPDHDPNGKSVSRRAIQLGIKGQVFKRFASGDIIESIQDITEFVKEQSELVNAGKLEELMIPEEHEYIIKDEEIRKQIFMDS